jgi:hypothetical protein
LDIVDSSNTNHSVSTKPGQLQPLPCGQERCRYFLENDPRDQQLNAFSRLKGGERLDDAGV